jgi:signal transduction histidine kinase/CheY-like chemotaxis protein
MTALPVLALIGVFLLIVLVSTSWALALRNRVRGAAGEIARQCEAKSQLESKLRQAAKLEAVGRLAGGIAHDFNNLLTVINGCAEILEHTFRDDPDRAAELLRDLRRAGDKAAALTGQLLAFSRQKVFAPHPVNLNELVTETAGLLGRVISEAVTVRVDAAARFPVARAESGLVTQILFNLAVNARDAMPHGGTLTLATGNPGPDWVRLSVADTGCGMTDEVKARIFEPFFTTKEVGKGTGLGLATVFGIVETLGGKIQFRSEPGRGTTFEIDLPRDATVPAHRAGPLTPLWLPTAPPSAVLRVAHRNETSPHLRAQERVDGVVLLVEDDDAVRLLARQILVQAGLTVVPAATPEEALELLATLERVDVLMTDVVMPGMGGRELAERVRGQRPGVRAVFMSGYTPDEVLRQGVLRDRVEFLQKPFTPDQLATRVLQVLSAEC